MQQSSVESVFLGATLVYVIDSRDNGQCYDSLSTEYFILALKKAHPHVSEYPRTVPHRMRSPPIGHPDNVS